MKIDVAGSYPLKDARKAHEDLEGRKTTGSLILRSLNRRAAAFHRTRAAQIEAFCRAAFCWNMTLPAGCAGRVCVRMGRITTHVLDTAAGRPAAGLKVMLTRLDGAPEGRSPRPSPTRTGAATSRCLRARLSRAASTRSRFTSATISAAPGAKLARSAVSRCRAAALRRRRGRALSRAAAGLAVRLFDLPGQLMRGEIRFLRRGKVVKLRGRFADADACSTTCA